MSNRNKQVIHKSFSQSAAGYHTSATVQQYVSAVLIQMAQTCSLPPLSQVLDLGCGSQRFNGTCLGNQKTPYVIGLDFVLPMLLQARKNQGTDGGWVCGDCESLPFAARSFDLIYSSSVLHWCNDADKTLGESCRVLRDQGLLLMATYGTRTLCELRNSWAGVDSYSHTLNFLSLDHWKNKLKRSGFTLVQAHQQTKVVMHDSVRQLMDSLKSLGVKNCRDDRPSGLITPRQLQTMQSRYHQQYAIGNCIPASYELLLFIARRR